MSALYYDSDNDENENINPTFTRENEAPISDDDAQIAKSKGKVIDYQRVDVFENQHTVGLNEKLKFWSKKREHKTAFGTKKFYYCKIDKQTCSMKAYALHSNSSEKVEFWESVGEHNHASEPKPLGIENKNRIRELFDQVIFKNKSTV